MKLLLPLLLLPLANATRSSSSLEVGKWRLTRESFRGYWLDHFTELLRSGQFSRRGHLLLLCLLLHIVVHNLMMLISALS